MPNIKNSQVIRTKKERRCSSVLIVDDESFIRNILMRMVERAGFNVTGSENGKKAVELLKKSKYDIVITDIAMPEMTGLELLAWIKQEQPETYVLLITGNREKYTAEQATDAGADHYISKPFHNIDITRSLATVQTKIDSRKERIRRIKAQPKKS